MLKKITHYLHEKYHPKAILLHGSRARTDALENSDYDIAIILEEPERPMSQLYEGKNLDIFGVSPDEKILRGGIAPLWPCFVLFDDEDGLGVKMVNNTKMTYEKGPCSLAAKEFENRRLFSRRLINRLQGRSGDKLIKQYYLSLFYPRALRYWCEINKVWPQSPQKILPFIIEKDPVFYQLLEKMWGKNCNEAPLEIHKHLFKEVW